METDRRPEGDRDMQEKDGIRETDRRREREFRTRETGFRRQDSGNRIQETGFRRQEIGRR